MTSKSCRHAVLFTKDECGPCFKTKVHPHTLINGRPELSEILRYRLRRTTRHWSRSVSTLPTLIVTDQNIKEVTTRSNASWEAKPSARPWKTYSQKSTRSANFEELESLVRGHHLGRSSHKAMLPPMFTLCYHG